MIFINPEETKIIEACESHYIGLRDFVGQRRDACANPQIIQFLTDKNIEIILKGLPNKLIQIQMFFFKQLDNDYSFLRWNSYFKIKRKRKTTVLTDEEQELKDFYNNLYTQLKIIFDYDNYFSKKESSYSCYNLADKLNINTCIYCNRSYTKTVIKPSKITRPEFDHWFAKNKFPLLALSFYNLIPSCHICNSTLKGFKDLTLNDNFHPYVDNEQVINDEIKFTYYNKSLNTYGFDLKTDSSKAQNTVAAFKIKEIYETHEDEIADLRKIRDTYSESYLQKLSSLYKGFMSEEEMYRLAFGVHLKEAEFEKRPLSKMKRDILIELGIIKNAGK